MKQEGKKKEEGKTKKLTVIEDDRVPKEEKAHFFFFLFFFDNLFRLSARISDFENILLMVHVGGVHACAAGARYATFFFTNARFQGLRVVGGVAANCWSKPGLLVNAKNR